MNNAELERLLTDLESDRVERKVSGSARDRIAQAICAFANDLPNRRQPGVVFVGVTDSGECAGIPITDNLLRNLGGLRSDGNIQPFPVMTVQKRVVGGCDVAVVEVAPSDAPPVRFRGQVWVRVGPRRAVATAEEERRLAEKRRAGDLPFDLRPVVTASLGDLDIDLFRRDYLPSALPPDVLAKNERSVDHQLTALRLTTPAPESVPTVLGILVVGRDPRQFVAGAYVQFLRIDGTALTDPIRDQKEIDGPLPQVLQRLDDLLQANIAVATDVTSESRETRHPDYPLVALRQVVWNAVLHRAYDGTNAPVRITWFNDRVEVQNPGGPFGQVNRQNFGTEGITDYRNPHLAEAMKYLGYVQRFGMGIPLARRALVENGNPPLEFQVEEAHLLAVMRRRP